MYSTTDGTTWRKDTDGAAFAARGLFAMFVHNGELWLTGGLAASPFNDVWRSTDGVNWHVGFTHDISMP